MMSPFQMQPNSGRPAGWQILTIAGVPFFVEPSFLLFIGLIIMWEMQAAATISQAGLTAFIVFFSLLAHEAGHALMARLFGYRDIAVSLVMFGGNTSHPPTTRGRGLLITLAGPFVTLALFAGALVLLLQPSAFAQSEAGRYMLHRIYIINLVWAIFNLLPIYPMDGGQAVYHTLSFMVNQRRALLTTAILSLLVCGAVGVFVIKGMLGGGGFTMLVVFLIMFAAQNMRIVRELW